ncbi:TrbG/VirB9 family P-type conjugative transfer protein, partial [Rhizobium laguerreae]|uniref:TrbG/VirB9 family P-type conjugative transfer protein n=1 Tax=Rhizobium laguerreae TaxID=1076926 RepID=UPI001C9114EE
MFKHTAVLLLLGAGAALANQAPISATKSVSALRQKPAAAVPVSDPRIRHFAYNENNVYRLDLYLKSVTALQLSQSEEVESILIGDSASWEV